MLRSPMPILVGLVLLASLLVASATPAADSAPSQSSQLLQAVSEGNYKDAYKGLSKLAVATDTFGAQTVNEFDAAITCLRQLGRLNEIDDFREQVVAAHAKDWRVLAAVAESYQIVEHYGALIGGKFERGPHPGQAKIVNSTARDRVRALQLYREALEASIWLGDKTEAAVVPLGLARALANRGGGSQFWRLQSLTKLDELPDYDDGWGYDAGSPQGAPVDEAGNPIYYSIPVSWDAATSDGERWRWALEKMVAWQPTARPAEQFERATMLESQFGVETLANFPGPLFRAGNDDQQGTTNTWALDSLAETETIARLATGIKRFSLPDDQNFIKLYQAILESPADGGKAAATTERLAAVRRLASLFEDRRRYDRAAEYFRTAIELNTGDQRDQLQQQLDQIVGNWGQFESVMTQPAGRGASVEFRFRNGKEVEFVAQKIDVAKLLADVKSYLKSSPKQLDWQKLNVEELGYRLVQEKQQEYVGEEAARWKLALEPRDKHFDRRITVTTPLEKAGAYLVTAKVADGNTCRIVLWLADTAIIRKPMPDKAFYFLADAITGQPIAKANAEFFGYRQQPLEGNQFQVETKNFAEKSDADGQVLFPIDKQQDQFQWLVTATTSDGRLAYLGFQSIWQSRDYDPQYNETKCFVITDRPVYRPKQTVQFKVWVARAQYDQEDKSEFAHQSFQVEIYNPKAEKVYAETLTADNYGGLAGKLDLPEDATLGVYNLQIVNHGGGSFRVEEYKKPEFEVTVDAPTEPVKLGEKITATIHAKYYFGSPVTSATVKYKVLRTEHTATWYPPGPWDWLYGPGYWWFAADYDWYPGWRHWGCARPVESWLFWMWRPAPPPEIVAEREAPIGPDGTLQVEIDTSLAQAIHPDQDHRYQIEAQVVDESRRTIVGTGEVLVARQPFSVFAWVDRGYYRVGDTINASFAARRLDGHGVAGAGKLQLLKITYDKEHPDKPVETEVRSWDLATNADGLAELQIKASEKGQYRLAYSLTDAAGHSIEGGYIFTIIGEGFDGSDFRFNDLEIVPDKRDYASGDKVQLQVNTNHVGATILLFLRPANGIYLPPQILHLTGKSTLVPVDVTDHDHPNFFVEAVTVADGRVHTEVREIHVPPAKRILNVDVLPSAEAYQPGQHATVKVKVTDEAGQPFVGSTVLSIFDKSVEYISGGSNVADIKAFFWKWQRQHRPFLEDNLSRWCTSVIAPNEPTMQGLGIFGESVAEEERSTTTTNNERRLGEKINGPGGRGMAGGAALGERLRLSTMAGAVPMAAPMAVEMKMKSASNGAVDLAAETGEHGDSQATVLVQPTVRSEFADTALWNASLDTNSDGIVQVELDMPQNLTTWKIRVWALGHGTRVGEDDADVVTRKNIIVRMQAPRFFVETDEVVLSANVHNYLPDAKQVKVRLEQVGNFLDLPTDTEQSIEVPAGGERRVDWRVKAAHEGEATIRMAALTDAESDAVEQKFPVYVHGMAKMDSFSGMLRPDQERGKFEIAVPDERRAEQTRLEVRYSPTLAGAMVDALPYLIEYPYGCTEQTLNRFLPAVIAQKTLLGMHLDLKAIQQKRTNLNAQEIGDDADRAKQWKRFKSNPVFDEAELTKIVKANVQRLTEMQLSDGGWGWFSGFGEQSSAHTTATVVHGLQIAKANDVALVPGVLERGIEWLHRYQDDQLRALANVDATGNRIDKTKPSKLATDNIDALVYMVLTDASVNSNNADVHSDAMRDDLYRDRTKLAAYGLAMFGMALQKQHEAEKLAMIMQNLSQFVVEDNEDQTAYLKLPEGIWWYWFGSEYEAEAYYLKLLVATNPQDPVAPKLVKYLINNRKHATYWNSTRDTALVIEALADYLKASGEAKPDMTVEVWIDGQKRQEAAVSADNLFSFDNKFIIVGNDLAAGRHTVELRKRGTGPLYYNGYLTNFTLENDIRHAGLELRVVRHFYKLTPADKTTEVSGGRGQVVDQKVEKYDRTEIPNLGAAKSGDLIEIELVIDSKNDYEYILFEDMKAAGCEPVALQSGYNGNDLGAYMELRDNRVSFFVRQLARGRHSVSYRLRAEIPGRFSALPTRASAMYAPELRGNSDELKLRIEERAASGE
ncbi:MAG TPA: MG2 domain-containing protein [Lacipirellulaceae bacterium]